MFEKLFGKKGNNNESKNKVKTAAHPNFKKDEVPLKVEFHSAHISPYESDIANAKVEKDTQNVRDNKISNVSIEDVKGSEDICSSTSEAVAASMEKSKISDEKFKPRREHIELDMPIKRHTSFTSLPTSTVLVFIDKDIFHEDIENILSYTEGIANKFLSSMVKKYSHKVIRKYSYGIDTSKEDEDKNFLKNKGKDIVEILRHLSQYNLSNLGINNSCKEECVQIIFCGSGDFTSFDAEEITFIKNEMKKIRDKQINTYYITTNKYNFADLASLGFRNVESTCHEYNVEE